MAETDRQKRMKLLKHKLQTELLNELKEKPTITAHKSHKKAKTPIHKKSVSPHREASAVVNRCGIISKADISPECTHSPKINRRSKNRNRSFNDLLRWGNERDVRITHKRMVSNGQFLEFSPSLNKRSEKITQRRKGTAHNRLFNHGKGKEERMEKLKDELEKDMFRPEINQNSRNILNKKKNDERLFKKENGKTENLDFFYASPPEKEDGFYTLRSNKKKRRRVGSKKKVKGKFSLTQLMKEAGQLVLDDKGDDLSRSQKRRRRKKLPKGKVDPK